MDSKAIRERIEELRAYPGRVRADDVIALYEMVEGMQPDATLFFMGARMSTIQGLAEQGGPDALPTIATLAREAYESALKAMKK